MAQRSSSSIVDDIVLVFLGVGAWDQVMVILHALGVFTK
jgi:hypothetical protein